MPQRGKNEEFNVGTTCSLLLILLTFPNRQHSQVKTTKWKGFKAVDTSASTAFENFHFKMAKCWEKTHFFLSDINASKKRNSPSSHTTVLPSLQGHLSSAQLLTDLLLKEKFQCRAARSYPRPTYQRCCTSWQAAVEQHRGTIALYVQNHITRTVPLSILIAAPPWAQLNI